MDTVTLCVVQGELNAEFIKSRLEAEGIPVILRFETYFNLQVGAFCPFSVIVPRRCADAANEIIKPPDENLIATIPAKNRWLFVLARIFAKFITS